MCERLKRAHMLELVGGELLVRQKGQQEARQSARDGALAEALQRLQVARVAQCQLAEFRQSRE
jgi:hypothetical protein